MGKYVNNECGSVREAVQNRQSAGEWKISKGNVQTFRLRTMCIRPLPPYFDELTLVVTVHMLVTFCVVAVMWSTCMMTADGNFHM